ncbi:hypothetical protein KR018_007788 [Drosophila ironensis]|nr:hypothetical protein KR018_007788 [Drosophila ironensis]
MELGWLILVSLIYICPTSCSRMGPDYCDMPYCGRNHLACDNRAKYGVSCLNNVRIISMTKYRNVILRVFNDFRNLTAGGLSQLRPAARMSVMSYSMELEEMATMAVITCSEEKFCISLPEFYYVGRNFQSISHNVNDNRLGDMMMIVNIIEDWTVHLAPLTMKTTIYFPAKFVNGNAAKTALLMAEGNTHVGCAALRFRDENNAKFVLECAFSTDLFVKKPLFRMSLNPGTSCQERDRAYSALCAVGENYGNRKAKKGAKIFEPPIDITLNRSEYVYVYSKSLFNRHN